MALECIEACATKAESDGAALLCFPECFLQGYLLEESAARQHAFNLGSPTFHAVLKRLASIEPTLVIGLIEEDGGQLYNTAAVIHSGDLVGTYRKTHLLPSEGLFRPGQSYPVFEANGFKFGINICFDTNFSETAANVAKQGAQAILCPANNMLPLDIAERWKDRHNEIRRQRAVETGLWFLSADVTGQRDGSIGLGPTAIIHPTGEVVAQVPLHEAGIVTAEICW